MAWQRSGHQLNNDKSTAVSAHRLILDVQWKNEVVLRSVLPALLPTPPSGLGCLFGGMKQLKDESPDAEGLEMGGARQDRHV